MISQFFCYSNSSKNITCPSGKLKTEFTSLIAKSPSPRLLDTTFFARCYVRKTSSPWGILDLFLSVCGRANLFCTQVGIQKLVMRKVLKVYHIHSWKAFWSFSSNFLVTNPAKKEQPRLPITMFVIWAVCGFWLLLNIHLQSSRTYRRKNRVVRFKSFTSPLSFMFCFFLYPLSFLSSFFSYFLALFLFLFCGESFKGQLMLLES